MRQPEVSLQAFDDLRTLPVDLTDLDLGDSPPPVAPTTGGKVASWAVWGQPGAGTNTSWSRDLSVLGSYEALAPIIHGRVVFLALNKGVMIKGDPEADWATFHSGTRDYRLARAIQGSERARSVLWGAYMTDFFKGLPTPDGAALRRLLRDLDQDQRDAVTARMVDLFRAELDILGHPRPLLLCLGGEAHRVATKHLADLDPVRVTHYSAAIRQSDYTAELEAVSPDA